jgi:hypothetical protein
MAAQNAAESFRKLLEPLLIRTASVDTAVGCSTPGNADSLEQGKGAGSTVGEIESGPGKRAETAASIQEINQDPASGEAPSPKKETAEKSTTKKADMGLLKTAEAMEAQADLILRQAASEVVAELVIRKRAEAIEQAAGGIESEIGVDPETAKQIADAIANGEISADDLASAKESTDAVMEIAEATGANPAEVLQYAAQIDEVAAEKELSAEDIAGAAMTQHQAACEQEMLREVRTEFNKVNTILKRAVAEKDGFTAMCARGRLSEIAQLVGGHLAATEIPADPEVESAEDDVEVGTKKRKSPESDAEQASPESNDTTGEEQLAAEMLGAGIPADEVGAASAAFEDLRDNGVDEEVLKAALADELMNVELGVSHTSSPEEVVKDPKSFVRLYVRAAVQDYRLRQGK